MIGHQLFVSEPIGNVFDLYVVIFEIPMQCFINKPACCGADVSIDIYQLLVLYLHGQMCFPVNFVKFLRTPFLQSTSGELLLIEIDKKTIDNLDLETLN